MKHRRQLRFAALWVCIAVFPGVAEPPVLAQQEAAQGDPPVVDRGSDSGASPDVDAGSMLMQQYVDPSGRFGFVAPALWGRLPSASGDEVIFQNDSGDNIRVSIAPLKVDPKAFTNAYVDTYLKILAQTFTDVKFIGQRPVEINYHKATDYVFSGVFGTSPVTFHQVVLLGGDKVLYITFAGFGSTRAQSEQLFQTTLVSLWVSPGFGGATSAAITDPDAPAYVLAIPEGWADQGVQDGTSHMFRPPGGRATSAFVSTRVTKLTAAMPFKEIDDAFVSKYADTVRSLHPKEAFEMRQSRRLFLGGEPGVRYDYLYVSNYGFRRAILALCIHKGYLVAVSCDAADQSFTLYEAAFERLVTGFKFKS